MRRNSGEDDEEEDASKEVGLCYGITPWHIRVLCDNPWEGGRGYTPREVGDMTIDEILMLLCDRKQLMNRSKSMSSAEAGVFADEHGNVKGRAADGTPIIGRIAGKSVARQLMEDAEVKAKQAAEGKRKRRRKRGG